eukprot:CAMPEP_0178984364 /NCGR_PEP_ID=MMETSP0795-20121207/1561_1 /TAXON_ID=88552 /ORGANISM="Amoebophrya sp., Strain Ameob2" /LENGTH=54 /DNA_ID=CAMNT_0020675213 /DNA_START=457 /DNA_END=617 /DNA_ORIENTATION=+
MVLLLARPTARRKPGRTDQRQPLACSPKNVANASVIQHLHVLPEPRCGVRDRHG